MDAFAAACLSVFSLIGLANVLYGLPHLVAVMFLRPVAASIVLIVCSVAVIAGYTMIVAGSDPLAR